MFNLLPIAIKPAAILIGLDLVEVKPLVYETVEQKASREALIRNDKLEAIINDTDFEWKDEYNPPTNTVDLLYMDFVYSNNTAKSITTNVNINKVDNI